MRGRGLFVGVEFVADRTTRQTLPVEDRTHARLKAAAKARGLLIYPMGGTVDGVHGDHALIAPPFICEPGDIDRIVALFALAVGDVVGAKVGVAA